MLLQARLGHQQCQLTPLSVGAAVSLAIHALALCLYAAHPTDLGAAQPFVEFLLVHAFCHLTTCQATRIATILGAAVWVLQLPEGLVLGERSAAGRIVRLMAAGQHPAAGQQLVSKEAGALSSGSAQPCH